MTEYVAFDPAVEAKGSAISSTVDALGDRALTVLKNNGLVPLEMDKWYPLQNYLDAYREIFGQGFITVVAVGMRIPDNADWPPDITSVADALRSIDVAYNLNHRGGDIGEYRFESTGPHSGTMFCRNPYPSDLDFGIIYRTVQKFMGTSGSGNGVVVELDPAKPTRKNGADSCTFLIQW